jgi:hypothetical protein
MDPAGIAEEIEAETETVKRTIRRYKNQFRVIEGVRLGYSFTEPNSGGQSAGHYRTVRKAGGGHTLSL